MSPKLKKIKLASFLKENKKKRFMIIFFSGLVFFIVQLIVVIIINKAQLISNLMGLSSAEDKIHFLGSLQFWFEIAFLSTCWLVSFINIFSFKDKGEKIKRYWIVLNLFFTIWVVNYLIQWNTLNTGFWIILQAVLTITVYISIIGFIVFQIRKKRKIDKQFRPKKLRTYVVLTVTCLVLIAVVLVLMNIGSSDGFYYISSYIEYVSLSLGDALFLNFIGTFESAIVVIVYFYNILVPFLTLILFIQSSKNLKDAYKSVFYLSISNHFLLKYCSLAILSFFTDELSSIAMLTYLYPFASFNLILFIVSGFLYRDYQKQQRIFDKKLKIEITKEEEMKNRYLDSIVQIKAIYDKISLRRLSQLIEFPLEREIEDWLLKNAKKHIEVIIEGKVVFKTEEDNEEEIYK